ncbi:PREDICTED: uncharacterized protein LOC108362862 [Rhagoletis zephyria]|uniref:uncharacterized protein LOC108362862 n=1 Tax=Rhagoletis zephyria TaxID=28612 RepID=UPI00081157BC|nr:PREDICTED: uncharacterized protein LOC108362862 [Rhagoletis zephyria]XP_036321867.1 uncharacterized protein LOC118735934 [Rhagoletis pomonella]
MGNSDNETVDENQPPTHTQSATPEDDATNLPRHLRHRYWNSWEEMRLVELWRLHSDDVTTLKQNIPIFRTISEGMREYGFHVNAQEVRRRINNFKNKYIAERRRLELDDQKLSDWRLYPLVHCLLAPRQKNQLLTHQKLILDQLCSKIPQELINKEIPFIEIIDKKPVQQLPTVASNEPEVKYVPPARSQRYQPRVKPYPRSLSIDSSFFLRHNFNRERFTQILVDNSILSDQRDAALKQLKSEERSFKALESFLTNWQKKHEVVLQRLQCAEAK